MFKHGEKNSIENYFKTYPIYSKKQGKFYIRRNIILSKKDIHLLFICLLP